MASATRHGRPTIPAHPPKILILPVSLVGASSSDHADPRDHLPCPRSASKAALVTSVDGRRMDASLTGLLPASPLSVDRAIASRARRPAVSPSTWSSSPYCALFTSTRRSPVGEGNQGWTWIILVLLDDPARRPHLLGRAFGSGSRWVMGYDDRGRVSSSSGLLNIGITPRIDRLARPREP